MKTYENSGSRYLRLPIRYAYLVRAYEALAKKHKRANDNLMLSRSIDKRKAALRDLILKIGLNNCMKYHVSSRSDRRR